MSVGDRLKTISRVHLCFARRVEPLIPFFVFTLNDFRHSLMMIVPDYFVSLMCMFNFVSGKLSIHDSFMSEFMVSRLVFEFKHYFKIICCYGN